MNNDKNIKELYDNFTKEIIQLISNEKYEIFKKNQVSSSELIKELITNNLFIYMYNDKKKKI
jgi:hypothetical protein